MWRCFLADYGLPGQYVPSEQYGGSHPVSDDLITKYKDSVVLKVDSFQRKVYECKLCSYSNFKLFNFKRHMRMHYGLKFVCDVCGDLISDKYKLNQHKKIKHRK